MSSPGQKRGSCGHAMASFDGHAFCARCRDKKKGEDPCVKSPESECKFWIVLTPEQLTQLSTLSYRLKKEKREAKKLEAIPTKDSTLVDPLYLYISQPASPGRMILHLLSALEKTSLLPSICHPASLCPTDNLSDLLHLSALAPTPLPSISQPASLNQTLAKISFT